MHHDNISCEQMKQMITKGGQLIDVRSTVEFSQGALKGAVNIPIDTIHFFAKDIDKSRPVLLYCRTGLRSGKVKQYLEMQGFDRVFNIGSYQRYAQC